MTIHGGSSYNASTLFVFFGKNRKLGDSLVFFSCLEPALQIVKSKFTHKPLIITNRFTRSVGELYGCRCIDFLNNISVSILGLWVRFISYWRKRDLVLINLTGHSLSFRVLLRFSGATCWYSREKDFAFCSDGRKYCFDHKTQFEYCSGPLSLAFDDYEGPNQILPIPRKSHRSGLVAIFPNAAELRKSLTIHALRLIIKKVSERATSEIVLVYNSKDVRPKLAGRSLVSSFPGFHVIDVNSLSALFGLLEKVDSVITVDTGIYVLCCAMGVPCQTYFGPTQPNKSKYVSGSGAALMDSVRFAPLGNHHCDNLGCEDGVCIEAAVLGSTEPERILTTPKGCLLRSVP